MLPLKILSSPTIIISLVLLVSFPSSSRGHFLSEQRVAVDNGKSYSTFFTFAETPGIENVEAETMAQKAYENGVKLTITTDSTGSDTDATKMVKSTDLELQLDGKYLTAKLPENLPEYYALEGFSDWGVYSGHGSPARIYYYTSASKARTTLEFETVCELATNMFRVDMNIVYNSGRCEEDSNHHQHGACIHISVIYDGSPLSQANVTLTGSANHPNYAIMDDNGEAYVAVSRMNKRIFARAGKTIETPGKTASGESYDVIKRFSTSVVELHSTCLALFPLAADDMCTSTGGRGNFGGNFGGSGGGTQQDQPHGHHNQHGDHNQHTQNNQHTHHDTNVSTESMFLVIFAGFVGSLLGSGAYTLLFGGKLQQYFAAPQNEENIA